MKRRRESLGKELMPEFIESSCLGEVCPNFTGAPCQDSEMEWMSASATVTKGRDTSRPPQKDEAIYVIYGQRCNQGDTPELVSQEVHIRRPQEVNSLALMTLTGRYGSMFVKYVDETSDSEVDVTTLAPPEG